MITIRDVARKANVSAGTVSKVLKGYKDISDETRNKVMNAVKELGYFPNSAASTLSSKANKKIAIYIHINDKFQQIDEINMLYLMGALDAAKELNQEVITVYTESISHLNVEGLESYFHSLNVDGIAVFGISKETEKIHHLIDHSNLKFSIVDAPIVKENVSCVYIDHRQAQYEVAKQAIQEGDKVIYVAGKPNGYVTDMRLEGIRKLEEEMNFDLKVVNGDFSEEKAYRSTLGYVGKIDCIICASDMMAIGVKKACKERGVYVKITGFDGIRLMGYTGASMMTVKQDFYQIGRKAVEEVVRLRQGEKGREVIMPHELKFISYESVIK